MPDATPGSDLDGPPGSSFDGPPGSGTDALLDGLRAAVGGRDEDDPGTTQDVVGPVERLHPDLPARYRATPASSEEAAAILRAAAGHDLAVVATGGMTRQDWAYPPRRVDLLVDTRRLTGVVEHAAGDLIVVVRAGTPLRDLQVELARAGQQLALDDPSPVDPANGGPGTGAAGRGGPGTGVAGPGGTVGGVVAVNASGPRRMLYGTARDLLIGVTVVRPDGVLARAGGKVVKNVAGYDLGKLFTGSYGTLGLITECVFRLHPLPAATGYLRRTLDAPADAGRLVAALLGAQLVPSALEIDVPAEGPAEIAVLLEGTPAGVEDRVTAARRLLGGTVTTSDTPPPWWLSYPWRTGDTGLKLTAALSGVPGLLAAAAEAQRRYAVPLPVRGSAGTGVLYAGLPGGTDPEVVARIVEALRAAATAAGGHAVVLTAPAPVRGRVDLWGPVGGLELMRRVKHRFDPDNRFAPGRFVGGI